MIQFSNAPGRKGFGSFGGAVRYAAVSSIAILFLPTFVAPSGCGQWPKNLTGLGNVPRRGARRGADIVTRSPRRANGGAVDADPTAA